MTRREATFRGLAIFAAVWQGLWLIGDATLRRIVASNPLDPAVLALGLSMVAWLLLWPSLFGPTRDFRRLHVFQVLAMTFVVISGLMLLSELSAVGDDGWFVGASVVNLGAGLAGLYLSRRMGVTVVLSIVVLEVLVVVFVHARGGDQWPLHVDLIYPFYALALGLASVAARHALMVTAEGQDDVERRLLRQQEAQASNELTNAVVTSAETRLHETVLNTLTAIVRGGLADDPTTRTRLRERARESADVLRSIAQGSDMAVRWSGDLRVDLAGSIVDLEASGIEVQLDGVLDQDMLEGLVDSATFAAVGTAAREALINALRHSQSSKVQIVGDIRRSADGIWWRIRVRDDGRGFLKTQFGFGLRSVITEGIRGCGGRVTVKSTKGTIVTMQVPVTAVPTASSASFGGVLPAIALPVVTAFTAFTVYTIGATWQYGNSAVMNALTTAVFLGLVAIVLVAVRLGGRALMPWWGSVAVLLGIPVMTYLERFVAAVPNPSGDWSSEAGSALLFVVVATGSLWVAPAAAVSWFIAQELAWIELTQPGMFVIIVAALLGWQLRRGQARAQVMDAEASEQLAALAASQTKLAHARSRYRDVDASGLIALLDAVADGTVDPHDDDVRATCLREERMIRSVLRLQPEEVRVHRDLVTLAVDARDRGVDLTISVVDGIPRDAVLSTLEVARSLIHRARPESQARASVSRTDQGCVFRLVVHIDELDLTYLPAPAEVLDEEQGLVSIEETCLPLGATPSDDQASTFLHGVTTQGSAHV